MNITPHKITREQPSEPLHQLLLNFGKGLWLRPLREHRPTTIVQTHELSLVHDTDGSALSARLRDTTIRQVVTSLRMQHDDSEDLVMLQSLETLATAGEISFQDFIGRVQNLFPLALEQLDVPLRMKVASLYSL